MFTPTICPLNFATPLKTCRNDFLQKLSSKTFCLASYRVRFLFCLIMSNISKRGLIILVLRELSWPIFVFICSFVCPFVDLFIHSFISSFLHYIPFHSIPFHFIHSFIPFHSIPFYSFIHSFIYPFMSINLTQA